ncbi:MAG TPA: HNH endonuclease [Candidatus Angelobacter sp.]|nr:HNH endonuclease [Candidatus Angelobacter sp.]
MKIKKPKAERVWKELEDDLAPRLGLSVIDHRVYSHLLRHSHLEGKRRLRFSIPWLARGVRLSVGSTRQAVRRLLDHGALHLVERSKAGHVVEVRLPAEIRACSPGRAVRPTGVAAGRAASLPLAVNLEETDFLRTQALRQVIHLRERGSCFYCLRQLTGRVQCLDHVVPRVHLGRNSYRNLVSCCLECNSQKGERPAGDFLRQLYRTRHLTAAELDGRLRALDALASGKLPPPLVTTANPLPRKGRPPVLPTTL